MTVHVMLTRGDTYKERFVTVSQLEEIKFKQDQIIKFIKKHVRDKNYKYKLHFCKRNIDDNEFDDVDEKDLILWHPNLAASNLEFVKYYKYSIVMLISSTILVQQLSLMNPVNENMAVNHGFHVLYMDERYTDATNKEWKLVVNKEQYLITIEKFKNLLEELNHD